MTIIGTMVSCERSQCKNYSDILAVSRIGRVAMAFAKQTITGPTKGNCFAACIANLLGIPVSKVPNFCARKTWYRDTHRWLRRRGYGLLRVTGALRMHNCYHIAIVRPKRNEPREFHAVIAKDWKLLFDPSPKWKGGPIKIIGGVRERYFLVPIPPP